MEFQEGVNTNAAGDIYFYVSKGLPFLFLGKRGSLSG